MKHLHSYNENYENNFFNKVKRVTSIKHDELVNIISTILSNHKIDAEVLSEVIKQSGFKISVFTFKINGLKMHISIYSPASDSDNKVSSVSFDINGDDFFELETLEKVAEAIDIIKKMIKISE